MMMLHKSIILFSFIWFTLIASSHQQNVLTKDLTNPLPSGDLFPMVGFGTSRILGTEHVRNTLDQALAAGYRLFDTAQIYGNEEDIGKALKELLPKHNLARKDVFITSKLASREGSMGKNAYAELEKSLKTMNLDYLDLYLIHSPDFFSRESENKKINFTKLRDETWEQLAKGVKNGLVRNIGVSNYEVKHLTEVVNNDHGVKVAVNQVKWNPIYHEDEVLAFCKKNGIVLQAYFSLGGTSGNNVLLNQPEVKKVAEKLGKHPAQVLLRWALQQNVAVIPKSTKRQHMDSNIDLNFQISDDDMKILNSLPQELH